MKNYAEYIKDLTKLVSFNSVASQPTEKFPFGEQTAAALDCFLDIAKNMGFKVINYDYYAGEVVCGEGEEIGIIGHLDIVPAGEGWNSDPFTLTVTDDRIVGRGTEDDKGPLLLCLYALKELKNSGIKFNRKIRIIAGCNEETEWKDLKYLNKVTVLPEYGFSPDGDFPLSYAEKGVYVVKFALPKFKNFTALEGGTAINAVPDSAKVIQLTPLDKKLLDKYNLVLSDEHVISTGKAAHGSSPQKGINAFKNLFLFMRDCGENLGDLPECLFFDKHGIFDIDSEQGSATLSPDLIKPKGDGYELLADLRIPAPLNISEIKPLLDKFGCDYTLQEKHPPFMIEKGGWFANALNDAYQSVIGKKTSPIALGGSTFARAFKKGCAFGIYTENGSGGAHEANEYVKTEHIKTSYEVYKQGIYNLIK